MGLMNDTGKCRIPKPIHYKLRLDTQENERFIKEKSINNIVIPNFTSPVTSNYPKIYIVKSGLEIIYVGYTHDSIADRLRGGLSPGKREVEGEKKVIGKDGYSGYKWKFFDEVDYNVWVFEDIETPVTKEIKYLFENIEAEIVFKLKEKGNWPRYQSEIHFYSEIENQSPKTCEEVFGMSLSNAARDILSKLYNNGI